MLSNTVAKAIKLHWGDKAAGTIKFIEMMDLYNLRPLALLTSSPQPTQIEGDAILCTDVLSDINTLKEIINR